MPRAVLRNGVIVPIDPLPPEWAEGQPLWIAEAEGGAMDDLESWYRDLNAMCAGNDPADLAMVEAEIRKADERAKAAVRREMDARNG